MTNVAKKRTGARPLSDKVKAEMAFCVLKPTRKAPKTAVCAVGPYRGQWQWVVWTASPRPAKEGQPLAAGLEATEAAAVAAAARYAPKARRSEPNFMASYFPSKAQQTARTATFATKHKIAPHLDAKKVESAAQYFVAALWNKSQAEIVAALLSVDTVDGNKEPCFGLLVEAVREAEKKIRARPEGTSATAQAGCDGSQPGAEPKVVVSYGRHHLRLAHPFYAGETIDVALEGSYRLPLGEEGARSLARAIVRGDESHAHYEQWARDTTSLTTPWFHSRTAGAAAAVLGDDRLRLRSYLIHSLSGGVPEDQMTLPVLLKIHDSFGFVSPCSWVEAIRNPAPASRTNVVDLAKWKATIQMTS